jgi:hypothetical protein
VAWPAVDDDPRCSIPRFIDARRVDTVMSGRVPSRPSLLVIDGVDARLPAAARSVLRRMLRTALAFDAGTLVAAQEPDVVASLLPGNVPVRLERLGTARDHLPPAARRVAEAKRVG